MQPGSRYTGLGTISKKLIITVRDQHYTYKTILANNGHVSENIANQEYMTSSVKSNPTKSSGKQ